MTIHTAANGRLRISLPNGAEPVVEFHLDGWPLLLVDLDAGCVRANDLRATHAYSHVGHLPGPVGEPAVDSTPGPDDQSMLVGTLVASVHLDRSRPTHADIRAVQMDEDMGAGLGVVLDCEVRYRQLPQEPAGDLTSGVAEPR